MLNFVFPKEMKKAIDYIKGINKGFFSDYAEHVGVIRSVSGNLPNILNRISSHKKALAGKTVLWSCATS